MNANLNRRVFVQQTLLGSLGFLAGNSLLQAAEEPKRLFSPAPVTVIHNGVVVQNNTTITGNTPYIGLPKYQFHGKGPIKLQDHGDPSAPLSFRNIWIREFKYKILYHF